MSRPSWDTPGRSSRSFSEVRAVPRSLRWRWSCGPASRSCWELDASRGRISNSTRPGPLMRYRQSTPIIAAAALLFAACSGKEKAASDSTQQAAPAPAANASTAFSENLTPDPGGKVIEVHLMTDEQGNNKFEPKEIEAHRGDVIRFTLKTGVHNVDFLPDSNTIKTG